MLFHNYFTISTGNSHSNARCYPAVRRQVTLAEGERNIFGPGMVFKRRLFCLSWKLLHFFNCHFFHSTVSTADVQWDVLILMISFDCVKRSLLSSRDFKSDGVRAQHIFDQIIFRNYSLWSSAGVGRSGLRNCSMRCHQLQWVSLISVTSDGNISKWTRSLRLLLQISSKASIASMAVGDSCFY